MNRDIMLYVVRCVDVWTSLGAKVCVCVFQNVSPELQKGEKTGETS
jgi:hypothetical protein